MIAKLTRVRGASAAANDPVFRQICADVLISETSRVGLHGKRLKVDQMLARLIDRHCAAAPQASQARKSSPASLGPEAQSMAANGPSSSSSGGLQENRNPTRGAGANAPAGLWQRRQGEPVAPASAGNQAPGTHRHV